MLPRSRISTSTDSAAGRRGRRVVVMREPEAVSHGYDIEFRWKEQVVYWEGNRGCVFEGGWGVDPVVTVVPDASTCDRVVPKWLRGRQAEVCERLRSRPAMSFRKSETSPSIRGSSKR